jgi:hypothetical protein
MIRLILALAIGAVTPGATTSETPYVRSSTPNVWVRSVPEPAPPMVPGPSQVAILPGGSAPQPTAAPQTAVVDYSRSYDLPGGGKMAYVPPQYFPYFVATIGPDGRLAVTCVEAGVSQPHLSLQPSGQAEAGRR